MSLCTLLQRWDTKWIHCSETGHHSVSLISLTPPWTNPIICYQSSLGFLQTLLLDIDTGTQAHWGRSTEMGWIPGQWHQLLSNEDTRSLLTVVTWDATQSSKSNQRNQENSCCLCPYIMSRALRVARLHMYTQNRTQVSNKCQQIQQ